MRKFVCTDPITGEEFTVTTNGETKEIYTWERLQEATACLMNEYSQKKVDRILLANIPEWVEELIPPRPNKL